MRWDGASFVAASWTVLSATTAFPEVVTIARSDLGIRCPLVRGPRLEVPGGLEPGVLLRRRAQHGLFGHSTSRAVQRRRRPPRPRPRPRPPPPRRRARPRGARHHLHPLRARISRRERRPRASRAAATIRSSPRLRRTRRERPRRRSRSRRQPLRPRGAAPATFKLVLERFAAAPRRPRVGKLFALRVYLIRDDGGDDRIRHRPVQGADRGEGAHRPAAPVHRAGGALQLASAGEDRQEAARGASHRHGARGHVSCASFRYVVAR